MVSALSLKLVFFALVFVAVIFEIFADVILKEWALKNKTLILFIGLLVYLIGTLFWAFSLRYEYLSRAISVFTILNLIVIALVGVIYFKENLSLLNKLGICLGVVSIILVEL